MAHIEPRPDNFIAHLDASAEGWVKKHFPLYWRFWQWFQAELGQTDRKAFYRGWWVLMIVTVALLTLSIWFKL